MNDSYVQFRDGRCVNVAQLTTAEIHDALDALADASSVIQFTGGTTRVAIIERLHIELVARGLEA